ncbi:MAG: TlyA family RNA methyltransferase [Spirochaetales bacterium]|nr:TlyA family RNA methyltransferase [Spirochaetales bacterium]
MKNKLLLKELELRFPEYSREELFSRVLCGEVIVNNEKITNPSFRISSGSSLEIIEKKFVSRGGLKLEASLVQWNINVEGKIFLDAGSSTGGFTDCLLQKGATKIYSVDVGYNQLAWSLRNNSRVSVHEKCNIMNFEKPYPFPDAAVADLSFRSISGAAARIIDLTKEKWMIALVKPQFEIDTCEYPDFNGIIKDSKILANVIGNLLAKIANDNLFVEKIMLSPVKGRKGNTEFLFLIRENYTNSTDSHWMEEIGMELYVLIDGLQQ